MVREVDSEVETVERHLYRVPFGVQRQGQNREREDESATVCSVHFRNFVGLEPTPAPPAVPSIHKLYLPAIYRNFVGPAGVTSDTTQDLDRAEAEDLQ